MLDELEGAIMVSEVLTTCSLEEVITTGCPVLTGGRSVVEVGVLLLSPVGELIMDSEVVS